MASRRFFVEGLESRVMLAGVATPIPLGNLHTLFYADAPGFKASQIENVYGLRTLDTYNSSFPLDSNQGFGQTIYIIGAAPGQWLIHGPGPTVTPGDFDQFATNMGVTSILNGGGIRKVNSGGGLTSGGSGALVTEGCVEWARVAAPQASIVVVTVPVDGNGYVTASGGNTAAQVLANAINAAVNDATTNGDGGGIVTFATSLSYKETLADQTLLDSAMGQTGAVGISFIAPAGDGQGFLGMPAQSGYVTSVGGTTLILDSSDNKVSESTWLYTGGGQSSYEGQPSYQRGLQVNRQTVYTKRVGPDVALAATGRIGSGVPGGYSVYFDNTVDHTSTFPYTSQSGTEIPAAIFAGIIADANELRVSVGQTVIGRGLNNKLYNIFHQNPMLSFNDIAAGNNGVYQAYSGFDKVSGMGSPKAAGLVASLGNVFTNVVNNLSLRGSLIAGTGSGLTISAYTNVTGAGLASIGPAYLGLNLTLKTSDPNTTATINLPVLSVGLDHSVSGTGTVTFTIVTSSGTGTPTTTTFTLSLKITGTVYYTGNGHFKFNAKIQTIDGFGNVLHQGANTIFEATMTAQ